MHKVAVIGAGAWGKNLVHNFAELGALAAIADPKKEVLEAFGKQYPDVELYEDFHDVLKADITAVAIASPVPLHFEMARDALLAGKDVFVEKPVTYDSANAETLVALASERHQIFMVGHLLLYQPAIAWIKDYINSGAIGELYSVRHERLGLGRARHVENVLWDSGVHDVAVLLYMVGETPGTIRASGHRMLQPGVEDDVHVHIEFPGGIRANLHTSWLWPETTRRLIIRGSRAMLEYDEVEQKVILHKKGIDTELNNWDEGSEVVYEGHGQPLKLELEHFLARLEDRGPPLSDGPSAVQVIRVLEQVQALLISSQSKGG